MKPRRSLSLLYAAAFMTVLAAVALIAPDKGEAYHWEGQVRAGTVICRCPTLEGNCICDFDF